jgi:hypothetical protein
MKLIRFVCVCVSAFELIFIYFNDLKNEQIKMEREKETITDSRVG